jgi:hypothetical protein
MVALVFLAILAQAAPPPSAARPQSSETTTPDAKTTDAKTADTAEPAIKAEDLPVSIERIQRALAAPKPIELKEQHPVIRLEIFGKKPTIEDILGEKFWIGPAPYGGMTHQEFMNMVTPQLAQPYAGFTGKYLIAETALTLAEQWALKEAIRKFRDSKEDRERDAARKEVLDALAALEKARREAGLSDK